MADSKLDIILTAKDMSGAAFAGVQGRIGAMTSSVAKLSGAFGLLAGGAALSGIVMGFDRLTDAASDFDETFSKVKTLFGPETTKLISDWGDNAALSIGLSKQAALDAVGTMGNMFLQLGANTGEAANLSKRMVELSADLASFHNVAGGSVEVSLAMQSAFRGEYDALQRYIPTINAAAVQQRALADSGKSTATELTALEKAMAVHAITIESAGAATGDFSRTSGELANQQRIFEAQLKDLKAEIGKGFVPVATEAITKMNEWTAANKEWVASFAVGTVTAVGKTLKLMKDTFSIKDEYEGFSDAYLKMVEVIKGMRDFNTGEYLPGYEHLAPRLSGSQVPDDIYGDFSTPTVKPKVAGLQSGEEMFNLANFHKMAADAARYEEKKVKEAIAALNADLGTEYVDMWRIKAGEVKEIQDRSWAAIGESYVENIDLMENAFDGWASDFSSMLTDAVWDADFSFGKIAESFGRMMTQMVIQKKVVEPLFDAIFTTNADGNIYGAHGLVPFARGGVVNRPTVFPFSNGVGLMGEAGPEAIMPLMRMPSGKLGVESKGAGVTINIINNAGAKVSTQERQTAQGPQIDVMIDQLVAGKTSQRGSATSRALRQTYGAKEQLVAR